MDADGTYTIQSQTVGGYVRVSQDDADAGGLLLRPAGDTAAPWLPHNSPEVAKLVSELPAGDVG
jgi:hypothetical protein